MAHVLNRTTMQYLLSVNTPDYPEADWVISPDLSAVQGVETKYWKISGDAVSVMTQAEKDTVDNESSNLNALKESRYIGIKERSEEIAKAQGFTHATKTFALDAEAREKWVGLMCSHNAGLLSFPQTISTKDHDQYSIVDAAGLVDFFGAGLTAYKTIKEEGSDFKKSIFDATTRTAVDLVVDTR